MYRHRYCGFCFFSFGGGGYVVKRIEYFYKEDLFFIIEMFKKATFKSYDNTALLGKKPNGVRTEFV